MRTFAFLAANFSLAIILVFVREGATAFTRMAGPWLLAIIFVS
jgi:hypothetical protein